MKITVFNPKGHCAVKVYMRHQRTIPNVQLVAQLRNMPMAKALYRYITKK